MILEETELTLTQAFREHIQDKEFPCIAARSALNGNNIRVFEAGHMGCPKDDFAILNFLHDFVDHYRVEKTTGFHSAAVIFSSPVDLSENQFEDYLWQRLQALHYMDAKQYKYDQRVERDPSNEKFSFSLKEEAFFIIGMHPANSRQARRFVAPAIVFNPHHQFEELRAKNQYEKIKTVVRKRDEKITGSINPMLTDFGTRSEVYQYSGKPYDSDWKCPLNFDNG